MAPIHDAGSPPAGDGLAPGVMPGAPGAALATSAPNSRPRAPTGRPDWRFLVASPWHFVALGFGSGMAAIAPGTFGTLFAWASFLVLDSWLTDAGWAIFLACALPVGVVAAQRTGDRLGVPDSGHIVIDEIVAFWGVLWMLPVAASSWLAAVAFVVFRLFDIVKPAPIRRLDARLKNGFGVMLDDLVAAFYTLLVLAIYWRLAHP